MTLWINPWDERTLVSTALISLRSFSLPKALVIFIMVILLAGLQIEGLDTMRAKEWVRERHSDWKKKGWQTEKREKKTDINVVRLARDFGYVSKPSERPYCLTIYIGRILTKLNLKNYYILNVTQAANHKVYRDSTHNCFQ